MDKSPYHIQITRDFVNRFKGATLFPGVCLCSYDVTASLSTSVPIDPALAIIKDLLEQDDTLLGQNSIVSIEYHLTFRVLSAHYLLLFPK